MYTSLGRSWMSETSATAVNCLNPSIKLDRTPGRSTYILAFPIHDLIWYVSIFSSIAWSCSYLGYFERKNHVRSPWWALLLVFLGVVLRLHHNLSLVPISLPLWHESMANSIGLLWDFMRGSSTQVKDKWFPWKGALISRYLPLLLDDMRYVCSYTCMTQYFAKHIPSFPLSLVSKRTCIQSYEYITKTNNLPPFPINMTSRKIYIYPLSPLITATTTNRHYSTTRYR